MTHIRIEAARESATAQGRTRRALEKGASMALYDMTRPKNLQKDIPALRKDTESELQETQQGIRQIGTQHYANVFNEHTRKDQEGTEEERHTRKGKREVATEKIMKSVKESMKGIPTAGLMAGLTASEMFDTENLEEAIKHIRKNTAPGSDGMTTNFYAKADFTKLVIPHLVRLFAEVTTKGDMTTAMKEACLSVLYKGREKNPEIMKSYRPVAILPVEYRIMTRAIKQKLTRVVEQIVSPSQVG
jgi:hypothetical protein